MLNIPKVVSKSQGPDWTLDAVDAVPFEQVHVTQPNESIDEINAALKAGFHVVLSPGIYNLEKPIVVETKGQVVLGLGLATIINTKGTAAIQVGDVDGVRIA